MKSILRIQHETIMQMRAKGASYRTVARKLGISINTVKSYWRRHKDVSQEKKKIKNPNRIDNKSKQVKSKRHIQDQKSQNIAVMLEQFSVWQKKLYQLRIKLGIVNESKKDKNVVLICQTIRPNTNPANILGYVRELMGEAYSPALTIVSCNKQQNILTVIKQNGKWLDSTQRRCSKGKYPWPTETDGDIFRITQHELNGILTEII